MFGAPVGNTTITTSTQVVPRNYHARLFNINFQASGTSTTVKFLSGGTTGTLVVQEQNSSSNPKTVDFGINGYEFPNGIYVLLDAQTLQVTLQYRQEESNT